MPLQKPSPHRFIAPAPPSTQTPKPNPKSNLRHAISAYTPKPGSELQFKKVTPAKRFVVAPTQRQHASDFTVVTPRAPDRVEEPDSSASTEYTPRPKAARKFERVESIEEASQSSPSRAADDSADITPSIERDATSADDEEADTSNADHDELLFETIRPSKRRRTSPPSPTPHHAILPETPSSAASHRFRLPFAHTPTTFNPLNPVANTDTTHASAAPAARPHFILPAPTSPQKPPAPLPEIFSPSRRTQKYLPSGLASCVQSWIIEAAAPSYGGIVWGRDREDDVRVRIRVRGFAGPAQEVECWPGSAVFVRGDTDVGLYDASRAEEGVGVGGQEGVRVLLAGRGGVRGAGGVRVRVGSVVGIRAPTWEVDVGSERWTVGVDWVVL